MIPYDRSDNLKLSRARWVPQSVAECVWQR